MDEEIKGTKKQKTREEGKQCLKLKEELSAVRVEHSKLKSNITGSFDSFRKEMSEWGGQMQ